MFAPVNNHIITKQTNKKVAWISSDYFESLLLPQLLRGENDSKQSDEFQANKKGGLKILDTSRIKLKKYVGLVNLISGLVSRRTISLDPKLHFYDVALCLWSNE